MRALAQAKAEGSGPEGERGKSDESGWKLREDSEGKIRVKNGKVGGIERTKK